MSKLETAELTPSERRRAFVAIIACISSFGLIGGLNATLISLSLKAREVSETLIGLNGAALAVGILVMTPIIPRLARRLDVRTFIVGLLFLEVIAVLLLPISDSLILWFACRVVMGMVANGVYSLSETWLNQLADDLNRGRLMAVYVTFLSFGFAVGPAIVSLTGIDGWLPFLTAAGVLALSGLPLLFCGRANLAVGRTAGFGIFRFFLLAPTLALAVLLFAFNEMSSGSMLPIFSVLHGLSSSEAALVTSAVALGGAALQFPIGWLGDRVNRVLILGACALGGLVGSLALPTIIELPFLRWLLLPLWGAAFTGVYTIAIAILGDRFKGHELVTANAAIGMLWGLGSLAGPSVTGAFMDVSGANGFSWVLASTYSGFLIFLVGRRLQVSIRGK
jgi:MFS family permease